MIVLLFGLNLSIYATMKWKMKRLEMAFVLLTGVTNVMTEIVKNKFGEKEETDDGKRNS